MNIIELFENLNIDKSSLLQITFEEIIIKIEKLNVDKLLKSGIIIQLQDFQ